MKKEATDFALMAGAFATDAEMAKQVCKLLADGDVNETVARKMLGLVRDGKLASPTACTRPHYPWYWMHGTYTIPCTSTTITSIDSTTPYTYNNSTLTAMAKDAAA